MPAFANELRRLMDESKNLRGQKFLLTAAPQCVFPDAANKEMSIVRCLLTLYLCSFYKNYCGIPGFETDGKSQRSFNFGVGTSGLAACRRIRMLKSCLVSSLTGTLLVWLHGF